MPGVLSENERILAEDSVAHYRDFVRLGSESFLAQEDGQSALPDFNHVFCCQINGVYHDNPVKPLSPYRWPGIVCQPFVFGDGAVDWYGVDELRGRLDAVLRERRGSRLWVTRIARIYDAKFIFFLKQNRLRYWLRSIALRDSDDVLADLRAQGF